MFREHASNESGSSIKRTTVFGRSLAFSVVSILTMYLVPTVTAQSPLSKIVGTVTDQSSGIIAGAMVTVSNESTGYTRNATTNQEGYYELGQLPDGPYTLQVELQGFKTFSSRHIVLETRQTIRIDASLEVGEVTQKVEVVGQAPAISTDTAEINSSVINRKVFDNSPFNMIQSFYMGWAQYLSPSIQLYHAVGTVSTQNRGTIDGLETTNKTYLNHDTVQEVKILTSGTPAEYSGPMILDFVTQSGTNAYHGRYLGQFSNPALNALGPNVTQRGPGWPTSRDQMISFSGPVRIPKVYNGTDKTFFYFDRQWVDKTSYQQGRTSKVPPEAMRAGDFSFLPASSFIEGQLMNPLTGVAFPNNKIPAGLINPVAANLQKFLPATNYPGGAVQSTNDSINYVRDGTVPIQIDKTWNNTIKVDHQLTSKDRIGWALSWLLSSYTWDVSEHNFIWEKGYSPANNNRVYWTHVFSPQLINEFRAGIERAEQTWTPDPEPPIPTKFKGDGLEFMKSVGFTWLPALDSSQLASVPNIGVSGYWTGLGFRGGNFTQIDRRHLTNNLTWIRGNHSMKMGGDIRPAYNSTISWSQSIAGQFSFTGRFTGHPYGDFLLGLPDNSGREGVLPKPYRRQKWGGVYFQDNWRVSPRLNLELGLRYEHLGLPHEKNHMMSNFDPVTGSIVVPDEKAKALVSPAFPRTIPVKTAAEVGFPLLLRDRPQIDWYPRFGFAFRPFNNDRTVIRGGYGLYSVPPSEAAGSAMVTTAPFALSETFTNSLPNGVPSFAFPYPFPATAGEVPGQNATGVGKNFPWGYTQNWNLTFERELIANTGLRLSYIGAKGTSLPYQRWISPIIGGAQIYPNFGRVSLAEAGANMNYQGMEVALTHRYAAGFQGQVFYSWGHKHNTGDDTKLWAASAAGDLGAFVEDPRNRDRDYGRSWLWADQRLVISHMIELPFGRGRKLPVTSLPYWITS